MVEGQGGQAVNAEPAYVGGIVGCVQTAARHSGIVLRDEYVDAKTGHDTLLWVTTRYDMAAQTMRIVTWTDELGADGVVLRRQYRRLSFSWLEPAQVRALLEEAGFEIEALYGDFDRSPFGADSPEQIWVARRTPSPVSTGEG